MSFTSGLAIYFILWWLVFLVTLPFGVSTIEEEGEVEPGHAPSAPSRPLLLRKVIIASVVSLIVLLALRLAVINRVLTLDAIPWLPEFS